MLSLIIVADIEIVKDVSPTYAREGL